MLVCFVVGSLSAANTSKSCLANPSDWNKMCVVKLVVHAPRSTCLCTGNGMDACTLIYNGFTFYRCSRRIENAICHDPDLHVQGLYLIVLVLFMVGNAQYIASCSFLGTSGAMCKFVLHVLLCAPAKFVDQ